MQGVHDSSATPPVTCCVATQALAAAGDWAGAVARARQGAALAAGPHGRAAEFEALLDTIAIDAALAGSDAGFDGRHLQVLPWALLCMLVVCQDQCPEQNEAAQRLRWGRSSSCASMSVLSAPPVCAAWHRAGVQNPGLTFLCTRFPWALSRERTVSLLVTAGALGGRRCLAGRSRPGGPRTGRSR